MKRLLLPARSYPLSHENRAYFNQISTAVNCTFHYDPVVWSASGTHTHYSSEIIFFNPNGVSTTIINHESGHIFGLLDPNTTDGEPATQCQSSIMHLPWYVGSCAYTGSTPTSSDFSSVERLINQG
ncbi:MAG TPA: hypothetical protein VF511_00765 [Chthoniobacterales bacterium]